jgi:hypothetical protein
MRPIYGLILDLYPEEHRAIFGSEMLRTFERACEDVRGQGHGPYYGSPHRNSVVYCEGFS